MGLQRFGKGFNAAAEVQTISRFHLNTCSFQRQRPWISLQKILGGISWGSLWSWWWSKCLNSSKYIPLPLNISKLEKLAGLRPANFLAPAVSWWPSATWRALWALWIAVWRAVLSETTAVRTELPDLRAAPSQCSISWQRSQLLQLNWW